MSTPTRLDHTMAAVRWLLVALVTAVAIVSVHRAWGPSPVPTESQPARYHCPMHPAVRSAQPGECPICHMALVPIGAPETAMPSHTEVPGAAEVTLSPDRVQMGGVATAVVGVARDGETWRASAVVEVPEDAQAEVHVRTAGFLERVVVGETGATVRAGQVLAWAYLPQVLQTEQELLAATQFASPANAEAARSNLRLLGMSDADLDAVVRTRTALRAIPLRAPIGGTVTRREAVRGMYATPETVLYTLTDLARVRVVAQVDVARLVDVRVGDRASLRTADGAASPLRVTWIDPSVTVDTRSARVRLTLLDGPRAWRPGTTGEVWFTRVSRGDAGVTLAVPYDAVIDTGAVRYVFVETSPGHFAPRAVTLGARDDDGWRVVSGLREGERVVARGTFMLDAESRLQASLGGAR